ncbi:MAG: ATP-binding cassette domain-containing protein [Bifidobacteriaceae bacterium]|jgi:ATPase subunit of ABC transporter with duplicated ATPase domains|nr:ATP-binding cassette domain-containing protein [Bifidobacteriaceae bacterium]
MSIHPTRPAIAANALTFTWPDGTPVIASATFALDGGATGLVGTNGSGKSTLLRLLAGRLAPTSGSVYHSGHLAYLPQDITLDAGATVAEVLGVAQILGALDRIEAGETEESWYGIVGEDWDIETRTMAALTTVGLARLATPGEVDAAGRSEAGAIGRSLARSDVRAVRDLLHRPVGTVSGGEATALGLAARLLERPDVLLLDEPTNNLDRSGRERVHALVREWRSGTLVVVSHYRELLELVNQIAELRAGTLTLYGGGWSAYRDAVEGEQAAARAVLRTAKSAARREQREQREAETKLARRRREGKTARAESRFPKIVANTRRREAEVSAGKLRGIHEDRLAAARAHVEEAEAAVRDDASIRIDLPATAVPAGRTVLELQGVRLPFGTHGVCLTEAPVDAPSVDPAIQEREPTATHAIPAHAHGTIGANCPPGAHSGAHAAPDTDATLRNHEPHGRADRPTTAGHRTRTQLGIDLTIQGPEHIVLTGANGTGKTTLLNVIVGSEEPLAGRVRRAVPVGLLPQRLDGLDDSMSVLANVRRAAPEASPQAIRAALARFLFRGEDVERPAATLSGGERFRASLAAILLAEPAPQLLILDEPTNSLDVPSVAGLVSALECYRGALIVASHDWTFLRECHPTRWLTLDDGEARRPSM